MILDILRLVRRLKDHLGEIVELLDLPDINDPQAVYEYSVNVIQFASKLAVLTPTQYDDAAVKFLLTKPLASFESFRPWYEAFRAIYQLIDTDEPVADVAQRAADMVGEDAVLMLHDDPAELDLITLFSVIVELIRLIRGLAK